MKQTCPSCNKNFIFDNQEECEPCKEAKRPPCKDCLFRKALATNSICEKCKWRKENKCVKCTRLNLTNTGNPLCYRCSKLY